MFLFVDIRYDLVLSKSMTTENYHFRPIKLNFAIADNAPLIRIKSSTTIFFRPSIVHLYNWFVSSIVHCTLHSIVGSTRKKTWIYMLGMIAISFVAHKWSSKSISRQPHFTLKHFSVWQRTTTQAWLKSNANFVVIAFPFHSVLFPILMYCMPNISAFVRYGAFNWRRCHTNLCSFRVNF